MRLPTKEEFIKLGECYTKFDKELKGRWFYDEETGEKLYLPYEGMRYEVMVDNDGSFGNYWSSTCISTYNAYLFYFEGDRVYQVGEATRYHGRSVRLVSDEPFEGAVHVAGLYWKKENEEGYYTWDEAMDNTSLNGMFNKN